MSTTTESRPRDPAAPAAPGAPKTPQDSGYRSIADGELATAWTLKDYFGSLNTVMRLPAKVRRKVEKVEKQVEAKLGLKLPDIEVPKGVVPLALVLTIGVFVVRPIMANATSGTEVQVDVAFGVWEAANGKHAGRMFELGENSIAFRTSSQSPDYTWHKVTDVRSRQANDSTMFTITYDEQGKRAEFAFWYVPRGGEAVIRLKNTPEVRWKKTPYEPIARPRT